jgi:hypothetical protein
LHPCVASGLALVVAATLYGSFGAAAAPVEPEPVVLTPHKASYDLTLGVSRNGKGLASADGRIAFEFTGDACKGYKTVFRQVTEIDDGEGGQRLSDLRTTTWEDGKGKDFRFNIVGYTNGELTQHSEGKAARGKGDVAVRLARPSPMRLDLDENFSFPSQHMRHLIRAARAGKHMLDIRFYDGSEGGQKVFDTFAVIGPETPAGSNDKLAGPALKAGLSAMRRWPVRLSYFEPGEGDRQPLYTLSFMMFENGISGNMTLDFGSFTLNGTMRSLDLIKSSGSCRN